MLILVAAILAVAAALLVANSDQLIDSVPFYVNVPVFAAVLAVVGIIAVFLWVQGHRVWAQSKGYSGLLGLLLGVLVAIGFLILLALPARKKAAEAEPAVSEASAEEEAPADEGQSG